MTAMEILERCRSAESEKRNMRERITRYRESATRMTAALDGIGARSTAESDRLAAMMGEIDAMERAMGERDRQYAVEVAAAMRLLDMLPESECKIVKGYYVDVKPLTVLAREMSYSYGYVRALKSSACLHLEAIPEAMVAALVPPWYLQTVPS